jgi:hypothetical protein
MSPSDRNDFIVRLNAARKKDAEEKNDLIDMARKALSSLFGKG